MINVNSTSVTEKELLLELERILVNHRYKCASKEIINNSSYTYMNRIKKALHKSKVEEKRIAVLKSVINSVNIKIEKGMLFKEIFEPLPAIIIDELKNYSKKQKKDNDDKKTNNELSIDKNKEEKRIAKIDFLSNIIDEILIKLDSCERNDLLKLEDKYTEYLKINTSKYNIPKASGEILGALNAGMIESTRKNFEKALYNECRIKVNSNDKLSNKMSDELLRYRVAALIYTNIMCDKRTAKIKPSTDNKINYKQYRGLKEDVHFLGRVVREKYQDEYSISPKKELIGNYIGGQLTFEGLMAKRDEYTRKRDIK